MPAEYEIELFKSGLSLIVAFLSLGASWFVGKRLTAYWNLRQKRWELNWATLHAFHAVYGEFKEIVKIWRLVKKPTARAIPVQQEERWVLLKRACALESKSEALILRATSERFLKPEELDVLGLFRQAMQSIRESIRDDVACPFGSRGTEYKLLNQLAPGVASMLSAAPPHRAPASDVAAAQLARVVAMTSKRWKVAINRIECTEVQDEDA